MFRVENLAFDFKRFVVSKSAYLTNKWAYLSIILLVLLILLILAWMVGKPSGTLNIYLMDDVSKDPMKKALANELFSKADAEIEKARRYYRILSFVPEGSPNTVTIPEHSEPNQSSFRDIFNELAIGASTQEQSNGLYLEIKINLLKFLEPSYKWFGFTDYFLVFSSITSAECSDKVNKVCWNVTAQYSPSTLRTIDLVGTKEEISRDLAVFVLLGALRVRDDLWRNSLPTEVPPPFLKESAVPRSMVELAATANGIKILKDGMRHFDCMDKDSNKCLDYARTALDTKFGHSQGYTPVAAYGLALVEIDAAIRAARRLEPSLAVIKHLQKAEKFTYTAFSSDFLSARMESSSDNWTAPKFLELSSFHPSDSFITHVQRLSCALVHHRRANWEKSISMLEDISEFPESIRSYLEAARLDAKLNSLEGDEFSSELSGGLKILKGTQKDNQHFKLGLVVIEHTCKPHELVDDNEFEKMVQSIAIKVPNGNTIALREVVVRASSCRPNQEYPTNSQIAEFQEFADNLADDDVEHGRLHLLLFKYHMRKDDLDSALTAAIKAFHLPWARPYLKKTEEFARIENSVQDEHYNKFIDESARVNILSELVDLENCRE